MMIKDTKGMIDLEGLATVPTATTGKCAFVDFEERTLVLKGASLSSVSDKLLKALKKVSTEISE